MKLRHALVALAPVLAMVSCGDSSNGRNGRGAAARGGATSGSSGLGGRRSTGGTGTAGGGGRRGEGAAAGAAGEDAEAGRAGTSTHPHDGAAGEMSSHGAASGDGATGTGGNHSASGGAGTSGAMAAVGGAGAGGESGAIGQGGTSAGDPNVSITCTRDFDFTVGHDQAVAYQINPGHTGAQMGTRIEPPLRELWRRDFETGVSYPVIALARVFFTTNSLLVEDGGSAAGGVVHALDARTGATLWESEPIVEEQSLNNPVHLAYDRGVVVAATYSGIVVGLDAQDGSVRWRTSLEDVYAFGMLPVASGGAVFFMGATGTQKTSFVLDLCDGSVLRSDAGPRSTPTLGGGRLFANAACNSVQAYDATDGTPLWYNPGDCSGSTSGCTVYDDGALYTPGSIEGTVVFDGATGDELGAFDEPSLLWPPAVSKGQALLQSVFHYNYALRAFAPSGTPLWSVAIPSSPKLPVLVTPDHAFVLTGGEHQQEPTFLSAIDLRNRELVWQSETPTTDSELASSGTDPTQGMVAGGGRVVVVHQKTVVAYASKSQPACGNGQIDDGEACDDGNTENGDYCSADCKTVTGHCGDGVVQGNEMCDGAVATAGAICNDSCAVVFPGVMLSSGERSTCGLGPDGSVTCWGTSSLAAPAGTYRYLAAYGDYRTGVSSAGLPVLWGSYFNFGPESVGPFVKIAGGYDSYCAITESGALECEGDFATPTPPRSYLEVEMNFDGLCALTTTGELWCIRDGASVPWGGTFRAVAMSGDTTCAIRDNRTLACNENVVPPKGEFAAITAGSSFHCGLRTNGSVTCFGSVASTSPILNPPTEKFALIDAGSAHVCGIRTDGVTECWGSNSYGQASPPVDFP